MIIHLCESKAKVLEYELAPQEQDLQNHFDENVEAGMDVPRAWRSTMILWKLRVEFDPSYQEISPVFLAHLSKCFGDYYGKGER